MNGNSRATLRLPAVAAAVIALLAAGAGTTYLLMQKWSGSDQRMQDIASPANASSTGTTEQSSAGASNRSKAPDVPLPDVVVTLSLEAMKRAGIELVPVTRGAGSPAVRIPGTVEPHAYKQVTVTPLVAGRVTRVLVELGDQVRRGQTRSWTPGASG